MRLAYDGTVFMENALKEITKTLTETILIVGFVVFLFMGSLRTALVPLVAMPVSLVGAGDRHVRVRVQPQPADDPGDRAVGRAWSWTTRSSSWRTSSATCARARRASRRRSSARASWSGPIIAMTITLAAVYAPIGFQGGLTGSLFLEFAITLAAAVVVSGIVAVTLSPVMSSQLRARARQGRPAHRAREPRLRRASAATYARLLDGALQHALGHRGRGRCWSRWRRGRCTCSHARSWRRSRTRATSACSSQASPDASLDAVEPRLARGRAKRSSVPRGRVHVVADRAAGAASAAWSRRTGTSASARPSRCTARCSAPSRRSRACACSRASTRRCPTPGQYDVELVLQSDAPAGADARDAPARCVGAGFAERQVPVRRHRPEDRPARRRAS